jgi:hypothetical protein
MLSPTTRLYSKYMNGWSFACLQGGATAQLSAERERPVRAPVPYLQVSLAEQCLSRLKTCPEQSVEIPEQSPNQVHGGRAAWALT